MSIFKESNFSNARRDAARIITSSISAQPFDTTILCDCTSGNITIQLPPSSQFLNHDMVIKKTDNSAHIVIIQAFAPDTIDGNANIELTLQSDVLFIRPSHYINKWTIVFANSILTSYPASQAEVILGENNSRFVTPLTLKGINPSSPQATYTDNKMSRIDYADGSYKLFTYTFGKLSRLDHVRASVTIRKDFTYSGNRFLGITETYI